MDDCSEQLSRRTRARRCWLDAASEAANCRSVVCPFDSFVGVVDGLDDGQAEQRNDRNQHQHDKAGPQRDVNLHRVTLSEPAAC
jgi:hypothetical protein